MKNLMALVAVCLGTTAVAQNSTFTYQGHLTDNGKDAVGIYDLRLTIYDSLTAGNALGVVTNASTSVSNGLFITELDFGVNTFNGNGRWLQIDVRTNGSVDDFSTLAPRQAITASPYAIRALNATTVSNGVYSSANQTFSGVNQLTNAANTFAGNGGGLTNLNASTLNWVGSSGFWQTGGNSNTIGGTSFVGTSDNQALELKVNGTRALRLEPMTNGLPNVIGGVSNSVIGASGIAIGGGALNKVQANYSAITGGETNTIQTGAHHSTIAGGYNNSIQSGAYYSAIGGGSANTIQSGSANSTIAGGSSNTNRSFSSAIAGGASNLIDTNAYGSTISGGIFNTIQTNANYGTIVGGLNNTIQSNATYSTVAGGNLNAVQTNAQYAVTVGGQNNTVGTNGNYSLAAGRRAKANHQGAFVWADSSNFDFVSTNANSFSVRATGGARFVTAIDGTTNLAGVSLASGGGAWSSLSDRNSKENLIPANGREVLEQVAALPLATWNYKTQDKAIRHMGPMAQDFSAAFHVGEDAKHINTIDADGVALAAIQGLHELVNEKEAEIQQVRVQNDSLEKRLSELEKLIRSQAVKK